MCKAVLGTRLEWSGLDVAISGPTRAWRSPTTERPIRSSTVGPFDRLKAGAEVRPYRRNRLLGVTLQIGRVWMDEIGGGPVKDRHGVGPYGEQTIDT